MKICSTIKAVRGACADARAKGMSIALVPTMGALHDGHLSLVRAASAGGEFVVVSIFVNPAQFGPNEDLSKYPRSFERDLELLKEESAAAVFAPEVEEIYPGGSATWVCVEGLSDRLDGHFRPGHFRGVTTVVAKLFHIVQPDRAYFGQKDAAQLAIVRRMVRDLKFPVAIVGGAIVREPDGLAMSSRNVYLSAEQRAQALVLSRSLKRVDEMYSQGVRDAAVLIERGKNELGTEPAARLEYMEIVDPNTLDPVADVSNGALVAVAAYFGTTRLIDNILLPADSQH